MKHLVFVYGTLKRPYGNNRLLDTSNFVSAGVTVSPFLMRTTFGYPVVFRGSQAQRYPNYPIEGEVYETTDTVLHSLDRLEGHPNWYVRDKVTVDIQNVEAVESWMYFGDSWNNLADAVQPTDNQTYEWSR
jgi:gamma-glutamylaminecyclotransferase